MDIYCRKTLNTGDTCQTIQQIVNAIVNSDCKLVWFHIRLLLTYIVTDELIAAFFIPLRLHTSTEQYSNTVHGGWQIIQQQEIYLPPFPLTSFLSGVRLFLWRRGLSFTVVETGQWLLYHLLLKEYTVLCVLVNAPQKDISMVFLVLFFIKYLYICK